MADPVDLLRTKPPANLMLLGNRVVWCENVTNKEGRRLKCDKSMPVLYQAMGAVVRPYSRLYTVAVASGTLQIQNYFCCSNNDIGAAVSLATSRVTLATSRVTPTAAPAATTVIVAV